MNGQNYMPVKDFMEKFGVKSKRTIYKWIDNEKLEVKKILGRTLIRYK